MNELKVFIISDSIGETGELIAKASMKQFQLDRYKIFRYPYHNSIEMISPVLEKASEDPYSLLIYTSVEKGVRKYIEEKCTELNLPRVDVMGPPLQVIENIIGEEPLREPGLIRRLDENYFQKVKSVEFAIQHDDGKNPSNLIESDICLIGISRTSKTPLSIYLANKNYKVANIPLVPEVPVPKQLYDLDSRRIIGLIASPEKLSNIRTERLQTLGLGTGAKYSEDLRIKEELEYSTEIMKDLGCIIIDVTNKSIEETAGIILQHMKTNFPRDWNR